MFATNCKYSWLHTSMIRKFLLVHVSYPQDSCSDFVLPRHFSFWKVYTGICHVFATNCKYSWLFMKFWW